MKTTLSLGPCILATALCCSACNLLPAQQTRPDMSVNDKVRECVFRYQISKFGVSDREFNKHFFVGNGNLPKDDPSPSVIAKLQSRAYSVKGISQCRQSTGGVFDAKTKARGLAFILRSMKLISARHAQVRSDFFKDGKSGNNATYTVDNIGGNWKVSKCQITDLN